jgi:carotenoid 1,2-hydratase
MRRSNAQALGRLRPPTRLESGASRTDDAAGIRPPLSWNGWSSLRPRLARMDGVVCTPGGAHKDSRPLFGGRQRPSGSGRPDGGFIGTAGRVERNGGFGFDRPIVPGGYVWWYVDAISEDGAFGLTIIAFVGSVFSPYYAWSGRGDPLNHCAVNVALYGPRGKRWAMTERTSAALSRAADRLAIGRSSLDWRGERLDLNIDEVCVPFPRRLRGKVQFEPMGLNTQSFFLDGHDRHVWRPIAPRARVIVNFDRPNLNWRGVGYFDMNEGVEPLESAFKSWTWSRGVTSKGATLLYDVRRRDGAESILAMRFDGAAGLESMEPPPVAALPRTRWLVSRETRSDNRTASVERAFEDTPFYARSLVSSTLFGEKVSSVHESLSLTRFSNPVVRLMLPFRMPRRPG